MDLAGSLRRQDALILPIKKSEPTSHLVNIVMVNIIMVNLVIDYIFIANFIATVNIVITVSTKFWFLVCNVDDRPFHNHQLYLPISISIFTSYSPPTHTFTIQRTTQHFQDIIIFIYLKFTCQILLSSEA